MHLRAHIATLLALGLVMGAALHAEEPAKRAPANVMSFHGAAWLERPERVEEEQPDEVIAVMDLSPGDTVADIGCGSGFFARRIAKVVAPEGTVYGVDIQPEMLDFLRDHCEDEGIENVVPVLGDEVDPKLEPRSIDWMILADVYHEFQQPEPMLAAMRAALKEDGRVALLEYRLLGKSAQHIKADHRMSVKQVLAEWQAAGFELEDLLEFLPSQHLFIFKKRADCK